MTALTTSDPWVALREHKAGIAVTHMLDLFATTPDRFEKFSATVSDLKQSIDL